MSDQPPPPYSLNTESLLPSPKKQPQPQPHSQLFNNIQPSIQAYPFTYYAPYTLTLPITDVTKFSHPTFTSCPSCKSLGLTRVEKRVSVCQVISAILMICSGYLIILGIVVLIFFHDVEHFCAKCNRRIGTKKACCI